MRCLLALVLWLGLSASARTAEIVARTIEGRALILVSGEIQRDDADRFGNAAAPLHDAIVVLNSPGGNMLAGLRIGQQIRSLGFVTFVSDKTYCASACAYAWLGGRQRFMQPQARIGFHAAYTIEGDRRRENGAGNALVGAYLSRLGLSDAAIIYISQAPPEQMTWLNPDDAKRLGIEVSILEAPERGRAGPDKRTAPAVQTQASLAERAAVFVERYFAAWSNNNDRAIAAFAGFYAPEALFFGDRLPVASIVALKQRFAERWPDRIYAVRGASLRQDCDEVARSCMVTGVVDWDARSAAQAQRSVGVANFAITLDLRGARPLIVAETGEVVTRER